MRNGKRAKAKSLGSGGPTQHGPHRNGRRVFDVFHHSKPVPLVQADVVGRMRFEVATHPLFVRAGDHRGQKRAGNSAPLMCRVDPDRRQKPVRTDRVALVKPALYVIEIDQTLKAGPAEIERQF